MKKIFYTFLSLFATIVLNAQMPGGVGGSVLWLKGNAGASPSSWEDQSTYLNSFFAAPGNQPVLTSNIFNFNPAFTFNGSSYFTNLAPTNFPAANTDRSAFVVANATATGGFSWVFGYGSFGSVNATFQMGNGFGSFYNAYYGSTADISTPNYWNTAPNDRAALVSFTLNNNTETQFDRGTQTNTQSTGGILTATSANAAVGAVNPSGAEPWVGNIAEIVMFPTALSPADRNKVESYLAIKYGFTLGTPAAPLDYTASDGTVYWTGAPGFQHDIFGIGTDNTSGLAQTRSNSMNTGNGDGTGLNAAGNMILSTATPLADKQFLVIGNDGGTLSEGSIGAGQSDPVAEGSTRVGRNWMIQNTGGVGTVDLSLDMTGLNFAGGSTPANYRLMIDGDNDGDYATGTPTFVTPTISGNLLTFSGVTLATGSAFTIITQASALLPATWESFAVNLDKNKATLVWKTSSEVNVDHYTAEYSVNGTSFSTVGTVAAKNIAGKNTYSLTQENLPAGIRYFRIKRTDKDGRSELSEVKTIRVGGVNGVQLKANPTTLARLEMTIDVQQNQDAIIRVITTDGKILVLQRKALATGSNAVSTNLAGLAAGSYFLQVQLGTEVINKKFVKL